MNKLIPDLNAELILVSTKSMGFPDHEVKWFIRDKKNLTYVNGKIIASIIGWRYDKFERIMIEQFNASRSFYQNLPEKRHVFWYNREDAQRAFDYLESQRLIQKLNNINN